MKLAVIHSFYDSPVSGENVLVESQISALERAGFEVKLFSQSTSELKGKCGYYLRAGVTATTGLFHSPMRGLKAFKPDVIHVHNLFPNIGSRWLSRSIAPTVATLHNFRTICAAGTLYRSEGFCDDCQLKGSISAVRHRCYRDSKLASIPGAIVSSRPESNPVLQYSQVLIAGSNLAASTLKRYLPKSIGDKIEIIPSFVPENGTLRGEIKGLPERFWLFAGRISEEKGVLDLVRMWPEGQTLVIIGEGPLDGKLRSAIQGRSVVFLGGRQNHEVRMALSRSQGLVFPSKWLEQSPVIYAEALCAGVPVVARRGNAVAEDVARQETGQVFDDYEDLESTLLSTLANSGKYRRRARAVYLKFYSVDAWLEEIAHVYRRAIVRQGSK